MANHYLKATGNWTAAATWSDTDGGAAGAAAPAAGDNAYITANGNGLTLTIDSGAVCTDFVCSGATTATIVHTSQLTYTGTLTMLSTMTHTGTTRMLYQGTGNVSHTFGKALTNTMTYYGSGAGTVTFQDDLNTGATAISLDRGSINTNGKTLTCAAFNTQSTGEALTLTLGASVINCTSMTQTGTNATITANTATINISGTGALAGGNVNYNGATFQLNGTAHTVSGAFTCLTLRRTGTATKTDTVTFTSGTTVTCTNFALIGNSATNRLLAQSTTLGSAATITATNTAMENVDLMDITLTNAYDHTANLVPTNAGFETGGTPPTGWTLAGAGGTAVTSSAKAYAGTYSALETRNGTDMYLSEIIAHGVALRGITLSSSVASWASVASRARMQVWDGTTTTNLNYHTGGSTWEVITAPHVVNAASTYVAFYLEVKTGDTAAYFDAVSFTITGTIGDCGGNTNITFTPVVAQTFDGTTASWSTAARWTSRVPLPQDDVSAGGAGNTITVDMPRIGKSITFTGTPTVTWTTLGTMSSYGSVVLASGMTYTIGTIHYLRGRGSYTYTSNGKTSGALWLYAPTGTMTLADALVSTDTNGVYARNSSFNTANNSITAMRLLSHTSIAVNVMLGSSIITLNETAVATNKWEMGSGVTMSAGSSTIIMTNSTTNAQTFAGGGLTYNNLTIQGAGAYAVTMTGNNTFNYLRVDRSQAAKTLVLTGTNQTYNELSLQEYGTTVITLTGGTLTRAQGGKREYDYIAPTGVVASRTLTMYAGTHSTDGGGNTNWVFTKAPKERIAKLVAAGAI